MTILKNWKNSQMLLLSVKGKRIARESRQCVQRTFPGDPVKGGKAEILLFLNIT